MRYKIFRPGAWSVTFSSNNRVPQQDRDDGDKPDAASCQPRRHRDIARSIASFPLPPRALRLSTRSSSRVRAAPLSSIPPRFRSARQRNAAGLRDVIQFKNHSLSARTEISFFFVRGNTSLRASPFWPFSLPRALIHVVSWRTPGAHESLFDVSTPKYGRPGSNRSLATVTGPAV